MEVMELLTQAVEQNAADIFLVPGMPFSYKIGGRIICQGEEKIMPDQMDQMITRIYEIAYLVPMRLSISWTRFAVYGRGAVASPYRVFFPSVRVCPEVLIACGVQVRAAGCYGCWVSPFRAGGKPIAPTVRPIIR